LLDIITDNFGILSFHDSTIVTNNYNTYTNLFLG